MKSTKQIICLLALSILIIKTSVAQEVRELGTVLSTMKTSSDGAVRCDADRLNSLVYGLNPTLYGDGVRLIRRGDHPVRLIADVSFLQSINTTDPLYSAVEIICVKVENANDLGATLKLTDLVGLPKLKYICFQYSFHLCPDQLGSGTCESGKVSNMIQDNGNSDLKILYTVSIDN